MSEQATDIVELEFATMQDLQAALDSLMVELAARIGPSAMMVMVCAQARQFATAAIEPDD